MNFDKLVNQTKTRLTLNDEEMAYLKPDEADLLLTIRATQTVIKMKV